MDNKLTELKAAAAKYSLTLKVHRENPKDADAVDAWDEATAGFSSLINDNAMEIIIVLLAKLESKSAYAADWCHSAKKRKDLLDDANKRIAELEAIATDYADKFQKAQDAAKHLIIMNDKDKKRITELDRSETQLIDERDSAHAALDDMYEAITGKRPEWSNWFGFADAIEEVELIAAGFTREGNGQ